MATTPYLSQGAGIPSRTTESLTTNDKTLITGHEPALLTEDFPVADEQTISALHVVALDSNGRIIPALWHGTETSGAWPVGIAVIGATTEDDNVFPGIPVYRAGCFNPDALVWPASFDTDAKKWSAFRRALAPTGTNITLRRPKQATV